MEQEIQQILHALLECIGKYPDGNENKEWFTKLIQNSLNGQECQQTDLDLFYNATTIEHILATILAIDIKIIVKVRMVHKVITTMWEENNGDPNLLNKYVLDDKPELPKIQPTSDIQNYNQHHQQTQHDSYPNQQQTIQSISHPTPQHTIQPNYISPENQPIKTIIEEIEMKERNDNKEIQQESSLISNHTDLPPQISIGSNIAFIAHYSLRNRKLSSTNPYYITKGKNFKLGILAVNAPGNNKTEQLNYVANILKIPKNNDLINFEFWEGNNWITISFDFEEDLIFCQDKINTKEKEIIKFIKLSINKGKKKTIQHTDNTNTPDNKNTNPPKLTKDSQKPN